MSPATRPGDVPLHVVTTLSTVSPVTVTVLTTIPLFLFVSTSLSSSNFHGRPTFVTFAASGFAVILTVVFTIISIVLSTEHPILLSNSKERLTKVAPVALSPTITAMTTRSVDIISFPPSSDLPKSIVAKPSTMAGIFMNNVGSSDLRTIPERDDCAGALIRMQVILLLELCFEFFFLFLRCCADAQLVPSSPSRDNDDLMFDVTMRGYTFARTIYLIPVLILNCSILWMGRGPTGSCLSRYTELQITFAHLIMYLLYCVLVVVIGVYRINSYEKAEESTTYYYDSTRVPSATFGGPGPPTLTSSYFRYYSRPTQRSDVDSSGYDRTRCRINLGCCAFNF